MTDADPAEDAWAWVTALEPGAPDIVMAWRGIEPDRVETVQLEARRVAAPGSTASLVAQLGALAEALGAFVAAASESTLRSPGGEADWNVAQTIGHACDARAGLALAAARAAAGRWPADAPTIVPVGVPGAADAGRDRLLERVAQSQRLIARAGRSIAGHETDPCPLDHPVVGRLRCGEWLVFAGIHDLFHLEQLHALAARTTLRT
jgi:hypothetical protein